MSRAAAFSLLVFAAALGVFYLMAMPILADPDMPWHIAAGDWMLQNAKIPQTNFWSFSAPEQPWHLLSWGWDLLLAALNTAAGIKGIFIISLLLMAALVAMLIYEVQQRGGIGSEALLLTTLLAVLSLLEFASARPQLAGYLFILLFMVVLQRSRADMRGLYILPLVMLTWVNTHGSFIAGFTLLGAYGLEALWQHNWRWFKALCMAGLLCLVTVPLNPYSFAIYDGVMGTLASSGLSEVTEWKHFTFGDSIGISVWVALFIIGMMYRNRAVPLADTILSMMWFIATLWSVRNAAIFVLVSAPVMALNLQSLLQRFEHVRTHRPDPLQFLDKPGLPRKALLLALATVIGMTLLPDKKPDKDISQAIAYLQKELSGKRVLNDYDYGGRIIYSTKDEYKMGVVFIDSRLGTAYPDALIADYVRFLLQEDGWEAVIEKYGIEAIFISNASRFAEAYAEGKHHEHWQEVYRDDTAGIYLKK